MSPCTATTQNTGCVKRRRKSHIRVFSHEVATFQNVEKCAPSGPVLRMSSTSTETAPPMRTIPCTKSLQMTASRPPSEQ